eukprot:3748609-Pleurochrysis_carterae.AAC.2
MLGALELRRAAVRAHVVGVKLADGLDIGRDEMVVDVLNERVVMHKIRADEVVGLSNDGQPLRLSKGKPRPLLLCIEDAVDAVEMKAKNHHVEGTGHLRIVLRLRLEAGTVLEIL